MWSSPDKMTWLLLGIIAMLLTAIAVVGANDLGYHLLG
jgi:hypothetical protein